jgi:E1A/CREB-binding protein
MPGAAGEEVALVHGLQCLNPICRVPGCLKIKQIVNHVHVCGIEAPHCQVCKIYVALVCQHAKRCTISECGVYGCVRVKLKLGL